MKSWISLTFTFFLFTTVFLGFAECQGTVDNATLANITLEAHEWLGEFNWLSWKERADVIRGKPGMLSCLIELSITLESLTALMQTQYSAAAGLMALLPTIGALVGSPTKNLWIIYKLLPICGVLSLMQSLGGQLLPEDLDREREVGGLGFADTYAEWALTKDLPSERRSEREQKDHGWDQAIHRVTTRARNPPEEMGSHHLWGGLTVMVFCQLAMVTVMYIGQAGGIIAWWCTCWGWMFLWYMMVTTGSFLDSWANSPYPRVWKIKATILSHFHDIDANENELSPEVKKEILHLINRTEPKSHRLRRDSPNRQESYESYDMTPYLRGPLENKTDEEAAKSTLLSSSYTSLPTISKHSPFCILITRRGLSTHKKFFRLVMRIINSGFFIIATGLFSSVVLMSLNMATAVTCCIAAAGMIARIAAMWLVHYASLGDWCAHFPVKTDEDAIELLGRIVRVPGLKLELSRAEFCEGRVTRRSWFSRMKWDVLGLLTW